MPEKSYLEAAREALSDAMAHDPQCFVVGANVGQFGGTYGTTRGLMERFGAQRVVEVAGFERSLIGFCIGAAVAGARPVVDLLSSESLLYGAGELVQYAANWPALLGEHVRLPLVIRVAVGAALGSGPLQSGNHHSLLVNLPGLHVVAPSAPRSVRGLLQAAVKADEPVVLLEHKALLGSRGEVPDAMPPMRLDRGEVLREGNDVTLVTYGALVAPALQAAASIAKLGRTVEVIDLRCLAPLDIVTIARSVTKTGRLLIVDDAYGPCSIGAEVAAEIAAQAFDYLDAPIHRLTARPWPAPYNPVDQDAFAPQTEDLVRGLRELLQE